MLQLSISRLKQLWAATVMTGTYYSDDTPIQSTAYQQLRSQSHRSHHHNHHHRHLARTRSRRTVANQPGLEKRGQMMRARSGKTGRERSDSNPTIPFNNNSSNGKRSHHQNPQQQQQQQQHLRRTMSNELKRPSSTSSSDRKQMMERQRQLQQKEINELKARKIKNKLHSRHSTNSVSQQMHLQRHSHPLTRNYSKNENQGRNPHMLSRHPSYPTNRQNHHRSDGRLADSNNNDRNLGYSSSSEQIVPPGRNSSWQDALADTFGEGRRQRHQEEAQRRKQHMPTNGTKNHDWYLDVASMLPSRDGIKRGTSLKQNKMMSNSLLMKVIETVNGDNSTSDSNASEYHRRRSGERDHELHRDRAAAEHRHSNGSDRNISRKHSASGRRRSIEHDYVDHDHRRRSNGSDRNIKDDRDRDRDRDRGHRRSSNSAESDERKRSIGSSSNGRTADRRQSMSRSNNNQQSGSQRRSSIESDRKMARRASNNGRASPLHEGPKRTGRSNDHDRSSPPSSNGNSHNHQRGRDQYSMEDYELNHTGHSFGSSLDSSRRRSGGESVTTNSDRLSLLSMNMRRFTLPGQKRRHANDHDSNPIIISSSRNQEHRRSNESDLTNSSLSSDEDVARLKIFAELAPWLEHCRDPVALKKRANARNTTYGRNNNKIGNYDPMQDVKAFEMEEKMAEKMMMAASISKEGNISRKTSNGSPQLIGAVDDMKKICDDFARFFRKMELNDPKVKGKKHVNDSTKLDDILGSSQLAPVYRSFPKDILQIVQLLPGNDKCCDCGVDYGWSWSVKNKQSKENAMFGSPTYGILLCKDCAFRHITKGEEKLFRGIEKVIPFEDGDWSLPDILSMVEGGNQALINYIHFNQSVSKKQRRATMAEQHLSRRGSLIQSIDVKRSSMPLSSSRNLEDSFNPEFERIYAGKGAASYRALMQDRTKKVLVKKVLNCQSGLQ